MTSHVLFKCLKRFSSSKSVKNASNISINELWSSNLSQFKNNIAIIQNDRQLTYEELDATSNVLAYKLKYEYGLQKGDKIIRHLAFSTLFKMYNI